MKILRAAVGHIQGNCYIVSDDNGKTVVIDPGGEPERLADVIKERQLDLTHILLTHGHGDHLGGADGLAEAAGALVGCSAHTAPMLRDPMRYLLFSSVPGMQGREPDIILAEGDVIETGDLKITVIETPGHTPGDLTFEIDGHLFSGDLLFFRSIGRTDFPGGDFNALVNSVKKLMDRYPSETPVHPGHMQSTTLGAEKIANPFLGGLVRGG